MARMLRRTKENCMLSSCRRTRRAILGYARFCRTPPDAATAADVGCRDGFSSRRGCDAAAWIRDSLAATEADRAAGRDAWIECSARHLHARAGSATAIARRTRMLPGSPASAGDPGNCECGPPILLATSATRQEANRGPALLVVHDHADLAVFDCCDTCDDWEPCTLPLNVSYSVSESILPPAPSPADCMLP